MDHKYCLILAGGNGSRLWPVSRTSCPKQFMDYFGTGRTMLQQTYDRVSKFIDPSHIYVSTIAAYLPLVYEQLPEVDDVHILEEPVRRGTLASVAWGSIFIAKADPKACLFVTPTDQIIIDEEAFQRDVLAGLSFVEENDSILSIGIAPTRPETGYGYIQMDDEHPVGSGDIYPIQTFTEKPDAEFANIFLQEGNFLWNTGMLCFGAEVMVQNLCRLVPEYQALMPRMNADAENADPKLVPDFFSMLPNYNIDVSILEHNDQVSVMRGHFGWADFGTWASIHEDAPSDANGNVLMGTQGYLYESSDNVIRLPEGHIAVIKGLKGFVVAEEKGVLMICPREDVAAMRKMHTDTKFK